MKTKIQETIAPSKTLRKKTSKDTNPLLESKKCAAVLATKK